MNINHNHTNATEFEEADKLERDIESIQNYLRLLFDELKRRIRTYLSFHPFVVKHHKLLIILGVILFSRLMFPPRPKKKSTKNKDLKRSETNSKLPLSIIPKVKADSNMPFDFTYIHSRCDRLQSKCSVYLGILIYNAKSIR